MLELLSNPQLIRLDFGIFILHFVLTAMFVVVPIIMLERLGLETRDHWQVYIPALLGSIVFMVPMIILSGRKNLLVKVFLAAIGILFVAQLLLIRSPSTVIALTLSMFFFFWGFNLLEAMLPSMVSRLAPAACKGSAMGVYNTFQFLGVFFGGFVGGVIYGNIGVSAVFVVCALMLLIWLYLAYSAPKLRLLDSLVVDVNHAAGMDCKTRLEAVEGVEEVIIIEGESTAYLKVDNERLNQQALEKIIVL
jgi:MFS family permease